MNLSFWEHLDALRGVLIRCVGVWLVCAVAMFCLRDGIFAVLFAPASPDFVVYRLLGQLSFINFTPSTPQFINTQLAAQFTTHLEVAAIAGLILAFPYVLWQLFGFVKPALYSREKRAAQWIMGLGNLLFLAGILLNYFVIFPFAFHFLSTYQVQPQVVNQIALSSYISTLLILSLVMGLLFEMPIVAWALAKTGLLHAHTLRHYRKHAVVVLMIVAAVITPTGDAFTLILVALPLYILYELSIIVIQKTER